MTHAKTMIINNMTNFIKNLEQSLNVCDIIDDLNKLILTLRGRNHDIMNEAVTVTPVQIKTETKSKAEPVQKQTKAAETKNTVTVTAAAGPPRPAVPGPRPEPVQKKQTKALAPGREKIECQCGLMVVMQPYQHMRKEPNTRRQWPRKRRQK